ncbi:MAG: hypothetical protein WCX95_03395 [Candidatus Gracilibacteria bacterium]
MKNKKLHLFTLGFSIFKEKFLTFENPQEDVPAQTTEEVEYGEKEKLFFEKVNKVLGPTKIGFNPDTYPYAKEMAAFINGLPDLKSITFDSSEKKDGKLILKYTDAGAAKEFKIEGDLYKTIFWGEIGAKLATMFEEKNIPKELLLIGLDSADKASAPKYNELVDKLAKAEKVTLVPNDDPLVELALKELEALRPKLSLLSARDRGGLKAGLQSQQERERVRLDVERKRIQLPDSSSLENTKFVELAEKEPANFRTGFKPLELNLKLENLQINVQQWNTTTDESLNKVFVEWRALGIPVSNPFYQKMFTLLRDANKPAKNKLLANPDYLKWFRDPENNLANIGNIVEDVGEENNDFPKAFVKAYAHFAYIRAEVLSVGATHTNTLEAQRKLDSHAVVDKPMDFVRANYAKFTQAIKEKDYATAGIYVLGIYAIYKSIKSLAGDKGEEVKKWLFYGVAGYAGYVFAKNAGYDILKMAGFKDQDAEVRGTPMEALAAMNLPEAKDLDYDIVLRVAEVKVDDLNRLFEDADKHGKNFIHPREFPQIFPDLANVGSFPMGIGEEGLADHSGNMSKKLTPKQGEYVRVGQQLFKTMLTLRAAYKKTLGKEEGKSFEDAMKDPVFKEAKIRHLCAILGLYAFPTHEAGLLSSKAEEKAKEQLSLAFKAYGDDKVQGIIEGPASKKPGIYKGSLKGFPVYYVYSVRDKKFMVYLANEYGGDDVPGRNTIAEIPVEGEAKQKEEVGKAATAVDKRMEKLLKLVKAGSEQPTFDGGKWTAKVKMPGNPEFGKQSYESLATITPMPNGDGLTVLMEGSDTPFNLDEHNAERIPLTIGLLHEMFNNPDFDVFKPFYNAKMLTVIDPTAGDHKFTLKISNISKTVDIKYDAAATAKFSVANPAQETELLKDPAFSSTYIEALGGNPNFELNQTLAGLDSLITKSCPTSFFGNVGKMIIGDTQGGSLSRFDVTSAGVPANYTKMVLENAKQTVLGRLQKATEKQVTFKGVEQVRQSVLADANNKFKAIHQLISDRSLELARQGKGWDQTEFMTNVVNQLRLASTVSGAYGFAQTQMEQDIYALDLPGFSGFDMSKGAHRSAGKLMKVFTYHTAHLDNEEYPFASGKKIVGLDYLPSAPTPTPGISKAKEDPALRGYMVVRYFKYVKDQVFQKAGQLSSLEEINIPAPGSPHWGILDFDHWADTIGDYQTLDPMDNLPAMVHDPKKHELKDARGNYDVEHMDTELDLYLRAEYDKAVNYLLLELGPGVLDMASINNYLQGTETDDDEPGLFEIYQDDENKPPKSPAWDITNKIGRDCQGKRSLQTQMVQKRVDDFVKLIYTAKWPTGKAKFIVEQPGVFDRVKYALKKKWPTLFS